MEVRDLCLYRSNDGNKRSLTPIISCNAFESFSNQQQGNTARRITRWTSRDFEFSILGTGFKLGKADSEPNSSSWIERVEALEKLIQENIDDSTYLIIFDELDEDYKDIAIGVDSQYTALLTSLFKAVQDIKSVFNNPEHKIFPVVFLRDDIYEILRDPDKTKWSDLAIELDWNTDKIRKLLAFRISRAISANGPIFTFHDAWNSLFSTDYVRRVDKRVPIFDYITKSTFIRPRDYIRYLKACAEAALATDQRRVNSDIVIKVDKAFSNYLRSEMEDEMHGLLPEIRDILDIIAHIRKQTFARQDFITEYAKAVARRSVRDRGAETVLKLLFHFSVIGNQPRQLNTQVFRYLNKEARLNHNEMLVVHRGLFKALQIL